MRLATVLIFLWFADALAEPATARLEFVRSDAAAGCGDEAALREGVRRRLGVDPFVEDAKRLVSVRIDTDADALVARIDMVQEGRRARRTLRSSRRDCADLSAAVELSVSLAVDPQWRPSAPPSEDPPAEEPATAVAPFPPLGKEMGPIDVTDEPPIVEKSGEPGPWQLGFGLFASYGTAPALIMGARIPIGRRLGPRILAIEPWITLPAGTSAPGGRVSIGMLGASILVCRPIAAFSLCGLASGGAFESVGEGDGFTERVRSRAPFAAAGGRGAWTTPLGAKLDLRVTLDAVVPFVRTRLYAQTTAGPVEAWVTPWVLPSLGLEMIGNFP